MCQHQWQPAEPTLITESRDRGGQEGCRQIEGADDIEGRSQQGGRLRVRLLPGRDRRGALHDQGAVLLGFGEGQNGQASGHRRGAP